MLHVASGNFGISVINVYRSFFPPTKKNRWPTWETHDWLVTPEYVLTLHCLSLPHLVCLVIFVLGGGVFCFLCMVVVDFTMSKYISPWHLSLLCSIYTLTHSQQSATGIKAAHFSPPIWCYSCRIDAVPQLHIHYGASRTAPYGHINCPADIVPSYK